MNEKEIELKYGKPKWAVQQIVRLSGLVEDVCKHGVGHPNKKFLDLHPKMRENGYGIHGCDGCCHEKKMSKAKCKYIGKKSICKIDNEHCGTNGKYNPYDEIYGICTRKSCYEQGKKDAIREFKENPYLFLSKQKLKEVDVNESK